jgi:hypothetical protein
MDLPVFVAASINLCGPPQPASRLLPPTKQAIKNRPHKAGFLLLLPGQKLSRFGQRHARESLNGSSPTGSGHRSEPFKKAG